MKKILIIFMVILSGFVFWMTYENKVSQEIQNIRNVQEEIGVPFQIPSTMYTNDPVLTSRFLAEASEMTGVNIIRSSQILEGRIDKFVWMNNESNFWQAFNITNGTRLTNEQTQDSYYFLSTVATNESNQIGTLSLFGGSTEVNIYPLAVAFESLMTAGRYFVELPAGTTLEDFLEVLIGLYNNYFDFIEGYELSIEEFTVSQANTMQFVDFNWQVPLFMLLSGVTIIVGIYFTATQAKKISIMKLNGLKIFDIWLLIIGKTIVVTMAVISAIAILVAIALSLLNQNLNFAITILLYQVLLTLGALFLSLIVSIVIKKISIGTGVKNKNNTKFIFNLNTLIKILLTIVVLIMGTHVWNTYSGLIDEEGQFASWNKSDEFAVFFPLSTGNDNIAEYGWRYFDISSQEHLYPVLNEMGSILIHTTSYETIEFELNGVVDGDYNRWETSFGYGWRNVTVNPNYLHTFPIVDVDGNVIELSDTEERVILLIPEHYRGNEDSILLDFQDNRWMSVGITREHGIYVPQSVEEAEVYIIWLPTGTELFAFNPDVFPERNNYILDPIVHVVTMANSVMSERSMFLGRGAGEPFKVALIDGNPQKTFDYLLPLLIEWELDDNLGPLVTINEYILQTIIELRTQANIMLLVMAFIAVVSFSLSLENISIYFNQSRQKFIIKRVHGTSFILTYGSFLKYFTTIWIIQVLVTFAVLLTFDYIDFSWQFILSFLIIELVLSIYMISTIERKSKMAVLKGEA